MKLHTDAGEQFIFSSDDILASGKNIGKVLTEIIDDHTTDINDLKKYTKWLYKYGGTGSKGGSGGGGTTPSTKLQYQIKLAGIIIQNLNDYIIIGDKIENEKSVPLEIILTNANVNYEYRLKSLTINNSQFSISDRNSFNLDNDFKQTYSLNLTGKNKGVISILLRYTSSDGSVLQESVSINYIKHAYSFSSDIVNNDGNTLFINNESIFYANSVNISSGVNLKINYDLQTDNDIIVRTSSNILSASEFIINYIDKKEGYYMISFSEEFLTNTEDLIGDYSLPLSFYSNGIRIYQETINFTVIPTDDVFIKIKPIMPNAEIYKYRLNNSDILNEYNLYVKYYILYEKLNTNKTLSEDEVTDIITYFNIDRSNLNELTLFEDLTNILYDQLNNYKFYVFSTGNIGFTISPYMPQNISEATLYYKLGKLNELTQEVEFGNEVPQGYIQASQKNRPFNINIQDPGIYVLSIYTEYTLNKIYYYFYTYNKDNTFNWYRSNIENIFNINPSYLHYFRNGHTTTAFRKYINNQYIQQFTSGDDITLCNINNAINSNDTYDCFVSLGIQYSYINNANNYKNRIPIITINSNDNGNNLKLDIYQDKIILGNNLITLFLPKEQNYNVTDNSKYHLLSIYKRYLYYNATPYYEICVYLDGVLEGALQSFSNSTAVWNSIILHNANYGINLAEISYLPHSDSNIEDLSGNIVYLDDIAISEYHYKYANECNSSSNAKDDTGKVINALRKFKETDYGMIEVENSDIIKEISKSINIPIIIFELDNSKNKFVNNFFQSTSQEGKKTKWELEYIYYSPGKYELDLNKEDCRIIPGGDGKWYLELQGSSTMQYFVKNLTLGIESGAGHIYLFTPNFMYAEDGAPNADIAKKTYLPEQAFTLKADMVDSSHCNNTSIGEFVNNNTKKFDIQFDEHSEYHKYVKNCLTGFPVLAFIKVNSYSASGNKKENIYYLGIYNFNLGRDSYFNMGYYDPILLKQNNNGHVHDILKTCDGSKFVTMEFKLTKEDDIELRTRDSVIVAEIQGNSSYNDFSQYDKSILSPDSRTNDDAAMFGDFVPKLTVNTQNKTLWHLQRLVEHVAKGGGYIFDYILKKHLGVHSYEYSRYIEDGVNSSIFNSANQVPTYRLQFKRDVLASDNLKYLINVYDENNYATIINNLITNNSNEYYQGLKNNLIELIFTTENTNYNDNKKEPIIDYPSLAEYYTICMAFGLTDSVMKNLNVKTWNASWAENYGSEYDINKENNLNIYGKWFVSFYDMDTAFGRYNTGTYLENSYFAFSDYWLSDENTLSEINIYRDFKPKKNTNDPYVKDQSVTIEGFDVPSSYLFAVAKYAAIAMADSGTTNPDGSALDQYSSSDPLKMYVPQNIWTKFRTLPNKVSGDSPYYGLHGIGELRNAQYFIDNYFSKSMNNIPEQLWNMNYRFKYLKRIKQDDSSEDFGYSNTTDQNSGFSSKELQSFHGRGIYQVVDWLNYRLHMLDAYFNVDQTITSIKYLDYNNSYEIVLAKDNNGNTVGYTWKDTSKFIKNNSDMPKWENTGYYDIVPIKSVDLLQSNSDVVILKDVFAQNEQGNRYPFINLNVKALPYSPLVIRFYARINQKKYLLINSNKWYNINIPQQTSSDEISFGGSGLWTEIENANSLIASDTLNIFSDKIQNLVVTNGVCGKWNIGNMKALNLISIKKDPKDTTSSFTGDITINESGDSMNHPDLTTVILDRTNMSLMLTKSSVKNVEYTYSTGNLSLIDCNNLSNVKLNASTITDCRILPGWSNNIEISNTKIKNLTISPKDEIKEENINQLNTSINISNDPTIETLNIKGFMNIHIENCPNLKKLTIVDPNIVKTFELIKCNTDDSENFAINYNNEPLIKEENNEFVFNMNDFTNLKQLSFKSTLGFNVIDISELNGYEYTLNGSEYNVIKLLTEAFAETHVYEIRTNKDLWLLIDRTNDSITRTATFADSYIGQYNSDNGVTHQFNNKLIIPKHITNLSDLFKNSLSSKRSGGITLNEARAILGNAVYDNETAIKCIYESKSNIKDLSAMFKGQSIECKNRNDCKDLSISSFSNVSSIKDMFENCNFQYISKLFFENDGNIFGSNCETLNIEGFATSITSFEEKSFSPIINKITNFSFGTSSINISYIYDQNGNGLSINDEGIRDINYKFYIAKLFDGIDNTNKITTIEGINIDNNLIVNWSGLFKTDNNQRFPRLTKISNSFKHENLADEGLHDNDNNNSLIGFDKINANNVEIKNSFNIKNISNPIDFGVLCNGSYKFSENSMNLYKICKDTEIISYLKTYHNNGIDDLKYVFKNLTIKASTNENFYTLRLSDNTSPLEYVFTNMDYTFESLKCVNNSDDEISIIIDTDSLKCFKNVKSWNSTFKNITLYKGLPLNMFNLHHSGEPYKGENYNKVITSMKDMFRNVKISDISKETWFAHEDYKGEPYNLNIEMYNSTLEGSYHKQITTQFNNVILQNEASKDSRLDIDGVNTIYGENIVNHLILPFDIFYGCQPNCDIDGCFADAEFEGIMPDKIISEASFNERNEQTMIDTFKNLLVIPNKTSDHIYEIIKDGKTDNKVKKKLKTYSFIPSEFTKMKNLKGAFNFKILLPETSSVNDINDEPIQEAYSIFMYNSILNLSKNTSLYQSMPGQYQNLLGIIMDPSYNMAGAEDETKLKYMPNNYYNILYFMMIPDINNLKTKLENSTEYINEDNAYNTGLQRIDLGFTYVNSINLKNSFMNVGKIFNQNLISVLYGNIINYKVKHNDDDSYEFNNFSIPLQLEGKETGGTAFITINGSKVNGSIESTKNKEVASYGIGCYCVLPQIINDENKLYKYSIELVGGLSNKPKLTLLNTGDDYQLYSNYRNLYENMFD